MSVAEPIQMDRKALSRGRAVCPDCGRKGVGYAAHAHALGWKDYGRATCRYCRARFVLAARQS